MHALPIKGERLSITTRGCAIGEIKNGKRQIIWEDNSSSHTDNPQILSFPENQIFECISTSIYTGSGFEIEPDFILTDITPIRIDIRRKKKVEVLSRYLVFAGEKDDNYGGWRNYCGCYDNLQIAQQKALELVDKNGKDKTWAQVVDSKTQQLMNEYGYDSLLDFFTNLTKGGKCENQTNKN